ncbi:MAG: DUF58 domain-containing protein [Gammaproteobacteria bacterium]
MTASFVLERYPGWGPATREGTAVRRRIYIFPTRQGLLFSFLLIVMLIGAINYSNSMAYLLVFTLASVFTAAMLYTFRNLRGLVIGIHPAQPVFAGREAVFPILIDNRDGDERISLDIHPYRNRKSRGRGHYMDIAAGELHRDSVNIPAPARGYVRPGRLRITSTWPLGLFRAWSYIDSDTAALVYPAPAGNPALPPFTEDASEYQSGSLSGTDDFSGYRQYRAGDSIRSIDWKVLAREQGVLIKRFSGSGMRRLILHWDQAPLTGDTERILSQLCLWLLEAEQAGYQYGLVIPGFELPVGHGEAHRHHCLKALATHGLSR